MFPPECIRQPHARFVLPHSELPPFLGYQKEIRLKHGILDQYHTSEGELIDVVLGVLDGTLRTSLGTVLQTCAYGQHLEDLMAEALLDWSTPNSDE